MAHPFRLSILIFVSLNSMSLAAAPRAPIQIAEYIQTSAFHGRTMEAWVLGLKLSPAHRRETAAYLAGHNLGQAALPRLRWKFGTSILKMDKISLNLAGIEKHQMELNGKRVAVSSGDSLEAIVKKLGRALNPSLTAQFEFWFSSSVAEAADFLAPVYAAWSAITYLSGRDLIDACDGDEATSRVNCVLSEDEKMIQADVGPDTRIAEFDCDGDQFAKITTVLEGGFTEGLTAGYAQNKLNLLTSTREGAVICRMSMDGGKLTAVKTDSNEDGCFGRTNDEYDSGPFHLLAPGDSPRAVAITVPLQRLQSCCKIKRCKTAMAEQVRQSAKAGIRPTGAPPVIAPTPPAQVSAPDDGDEDEPETKQ